MEHKKTVRLSKPGRSHVLYVTEIKAFQGGVAGREQGATGIGFMSHGTETAINRIEQELLHHARFRPDKVALVAANESFTYQDVLRHANDFSRKLVSIGVNPGDRVTVFLEKTPESVIACYGVWLAGGILVPAHEGLHARQLRYILQHSASKLLVSNEVKLARLGSDIPNNIISLNFSLPTTPVQSANSHEPRTGTGEPAAILYTSGSTGQPKGILIGHNNLLAGARTVSEYLELREDERIISILPFSFDYGLNQLLTSVHVGATLVLQRSHLPADICRTLQHQSITGMAAVPPLWIQLLGDISPFKQLEFPKLRYITNTGGVFPVGAVKEYRRLLPHVRIYLMYGLSEAFRSTYLPPDEVDRRPDSMGRAIPETLIHVIKDGRECAPGEIGELVHRGPTVALGYWRDPEATAHVFRPFPNPDGENSETAVYSGDYVRKDSDGFLYFVGRRDTMIKTQGFRVSPDEVEELILASGLVSEVAAHAVPDSVAGAAIAVHVVPKISSTFSEAALLEFCHKEMPRHMVPKSLRVHETLPRTASGKIDRKSLAS